MDRLNKDIISEICKYLSGKDLFHFLICNKKLHQSISIYRKQYTFDYKNILSNYSDYRKLIIRPKYTISKRENWLEKLSQSVIHKYLYPFKSQEMDEWDDSRLYKISVETLTLNFRSFENLYKLEFDEYFNQPLTFDFPSSLRYIKFGKRFNKEIDLLPDHIEIIEFDNSSDFNIETNKYPNNLRYIKFGRGFKKSINSLPRGVEEVDMMYCFYNMTPIDRLPECLKFLIVNRKEIVKCNISEETLVFYAIDTLEKTYLNVMNSIPYILFQKIDHPRLFFQ
jgi:hypothetical protein